MGRYKPSCSKNGISMIIRLSATPGSEQALPREAPARRVVRRRPFFRRQVIGLLYGTGKAPTRDRGAPSGARESQLFLGFVITEIFSKIYLDIIIITFTTEGYYIVRITFRTGWYYYSCSTAAGVCNFEGTSHVLPTARV